MEWFKWGSGKKKDNQLSSTRTYLRDEYVRQHLIPMDFSTLVACPNSVEPNEWLAMHVASFAENVGIVYGTLSEFCQPAACPQMTIPGGTLQWVDEKNKKKNCSAPQYIDLVMSFTQRVLDDESVFPTKHGKLVSALKNWEDFGESHQFPLDLKVTLRKLTRLLFHVLAHVFQAHYDAAAHLDLLPYLNTVTYHVMSFAKTFDMLDERELQPLADLHSKLHHAAIAAQARAASQRTVFVNGSLSPWTEDEPSAGHTDEKDRVF